MTTVLVVDPVRPDPDAIARAADCLRAGGLVAFPTETVYGLGVHALDGRAVARLFAAKGRPFNDPIIVHVARLSEVGPLVRHLPPSARVLAERFWPGPLTLVLPRASGVPIEVTAGLDSVGVRVPAHPVARALIEAAAIPVAAPSANLFSRPSPTRAAHVLEDLDGRIDLVIDGGPTSLGVESTVLDLTGDVPAILRPGAVTIDMIRAILPEVQARSAVVADRHPHAMASPGLLARHYSPRAPMTLYEGGSSEAILARLSSDARAAVATGQRVGVVCADEDRPVLGADGRLQTVTLGSVTGMEDVAARLYASLRELDASGVDAILARAFPDDTGLGIAVRDRMRRAAAGRIVRC